MNTLQHVLLGFCFLVLFACGKGFKVNSEPHAGGHRHEKEPVFKQTQPELEDSGEFYRVKSKTKGTTQQPKSLTLNNKEIKVQREKLRFSKLSYKYSDRKMIFYGQLHHGMKTINFELSGKYNQGLLDLTVEDVQSELYEKLKARATCYSLQNSQDESLCENFFIDVYYFDQGTVYTEQVIPRKEVAHMDAPVDQNDESQKHKDDNTEEDVSESVEPIYFQGQAGRDITELFSKELSGKDSKPDNLKPEKKKTAPQASQQKIARPVNQAVGGVGGAYGLGSLKNATSLMEIYNRLGRTSGFQILSPEKNRHYGTWDMIKLIEKMGSWVRDNIPGQVLSIGNISTQFGGVQEGHVSHQNGLDVDIAYFTSTTTRMAKVVNVSNKQMSPDLRIDDQFKLFKQLVGSEIVEMILVHPAIKKALCQRAMETGEIKTGDEKNLATRTLKRIYTANDHDDHFHLRIECSSFDRTCSPIHLPDQALGCSPQIAL